MSIAKRLDGDALLRILRQVERFEDGWKRGEPEPLESLLSESDGPERDELMRQALGIELDYRRRNGEHPTSEEYLARLPGAAGVIRGAFGRDRQDRSPDDPDATLTQHLPLVEGRPTSIGPYRLVEKLGEGGMGTVYLAEQETPVKRRVALKVIKSGMESVQIITRFETEKQALARMAHPNIARVFDGGVTDCGQPYFVMEYMKGLPITEYCHKNITDISDRIGLFRQVCDAVRHAQIRGIIHRDIKPSNVLVAEIDGLGVAKVIDFGIAKATVSPATQGTPPTAPGALLGTPVYMSPEQAGAYSGDIDTRSDVYSLGVLLYELLTGTTPIALEQARSIPIYEVLRKVQQEEPERPSRRVARFADKAPPGDRAGLDRKLRGDLDWIVLKAIAKDRDNRYESPTDLGEDLRRFLADLPVTAGPPSRLYRARKFIRRNRALVIFIALSLVISGIASVSVLRHRQIARSANENLEAASSLVTNSTHALQWSDIVANLRQIDAWLTDNTKGMPHSVRDRVHLDPLERARLRRAMLEEVLSEAERIPPFAEARIVDRPDEGTGRSSYSN
jgi:serine/threonine protein kinase